MAASTDFKRLFLRVLYAKATASGGSLLALLNASLLAQFTAVSGGKIVVSTMAAGRKVDFEIPPNGRGLTPGEIAEAVGNLLDLYDAVLAALTSVPTATTDAAIYAEMMARLVPRNVVLPDFGTYRNANTETCGVGP